MDPVPFPEDAALAARCAAGDAEACRAFVDRVGPRILTLARKMVGQDRADDAVGEVFVRLLENNSAVLKAYRGRAPLEAYLHVVARRVLLGLLEADRPRRGIRILEDVPAPDAAAGREHREAVQAALARLDPAQRKALELVYLEGLSQKEASVRLGVPPGTVATWISRSLKRMGRISLDPLGPEE